MSALNNDYIINCVKAFYKFEHFLNKMNEKLGYDFEENFGYLINYERIDKIKKAINYENNKEIYKNLSPSPADQVKKIYTIDEIKFRNSDYLLNMLQNKNNYIIINNELWKVFCKNDKEKLAPIKYYINYSQIKFKLDDQKELIFSFEFQKNDNLITFKKFYISDNPYYDHFRSNYNNLVNDIYKPIKEYYEFHKKFIAHLKMPKRSDLQSGFLVDIDWFKEWEQFYDFINIKAKYLDKNATEKEVIDHLIHYTYANKRDIRQLSEAKIYKFSNRDEIISFIRKKKLIIVNSSSIIPSIIISNKLTNFYLGNNNIQISLSYQQPFLYEMKDNVFSFKSDENEENQHLIQLIKLFYFRKHIINETGKKKTKYETNQIILIKKDIINKYLKSYNYNKLFAYLSKNFKHIDYKNLENNLETLLKIIKRDLKDYYEELKLKEDLPNSFNFIGNEYELKQKPYTYKEKTLKYIDDFDIIDKDIFSFFVNNNIIKENQVIKGEYISDEGQIFLAYCYNGVNNFQIISLNNNKDDFISEYIIECENSIRNIIINIIKSKGIKSFLQNKIGDKISLANIYCYCYPIKTTLDNKFENKDNNENNNDDNSKKSTINESNINNFKFQKQTDKMISNPQNNNIDANELKNLRDDYNKLKNELAEKEKEIKDLKDKLKNTMVINFISTDSSVNCGIKCLPTDLFVTVEAELYKKYDNLRNTNNNFTVNGHCVIRFQTIQENNIHDGDKILLIKFD